MKAFWNKLLNDFMALPKSDGWFCHISYFHRLWDNRPDFKESIWMLAHEFIEETKVEGFRAGRICLFGGKSIECLRRSIRIDFLNWCIANDKELKNLKSPIHD